MRELANVCGVIVGTIVGVGIFGIVNYITYKQTSKKIEEFSNSFIEFENIHNEILYK